MTDITVDHNLISERGLQLPEEVIDVFESIDDRALEENITIDEMTAHTSECGWQVGECSPSKNELHENMSGMALPSTD